MTTVVKTITQGVRNWWWFLVIGILSVLAGTAILSQPLEGYLALSILFSLVMVGSGISQIVFAISVHKVFRGWAWTLASGILDLAIGTFLLLYPGVTMASLPFLVGFYLVFRAIYLVGASIDLSAVGLRGWGWILAGGIALLALGFLNFYHPLFGAYGIVAFSGTAFIMNGFLCMIMAFQLKALKANVEELGTNIRTRFTDLREQYSPY